jgi:hypothetical protein
MQEGKQNRINIMEDKEDTIEGERMPVIIVNVDLPSTVDFRVILYSAAYASLGMGNGSIYGPARRAGG